MAVCRHRRDRHVFLRALLLQSQSQVIVHAAVAVRSRCCRCCYCCCTRTVGTLPIALLARLCQVAELLQHVLVAGKQLAPHKCIVLLERQLRAETFRNLRLLSLSDHTSVLLFI
jgi:hypothetical protein